MERTNPTARSKNRKPNRGKNATKYGKGVYFATAARYSAQKAYSSPDSDGIQRFFVARVLVGEWQPGAKDQLVPEIRVAATHQLFDSTAGPLMDDDEPMIYVTYHDAQSYPGTQIF